MASIKNRAEVAYYEGVGPENGRKVMAGDAFPYACERCVTGTVEEQEGFMELAQDSVTCAEFSRRLVEWFYSGNWIARREDEDEFVI